MSNTPKGYKQTEVGVIPKDWEVKRLVECCSKITDGTHDTPKKVEGGIPFITAIHVKENKIDFDGCYYLPKNIHDLIYSRCNPEHGDVLMVNIGAGVATTALVNVDYEFSLKNVALLKPNAKCLIGGYLNYYQSYVKGRIVGTISNGGAQPFLSLSQIQNLKITLPTLAEQTAIANALSDADALIQSMEKLIAKKRAIKQGALQELLTGKRRLPELCRCKEKYKQTELGMIPEDWEVRKLGEIAEVTKLAGFEYSKYFNSYKDGGEIVVIRGTNITHNKLDLSYVKTIPYETSNNLQRSKLNKNDIVFAYVGTIGPVYLVEEDNKYHLGPNTSKITVNKLNSPKYIYTYFTSWLIKGEIAEQTSVGAQPSLSMSKIRSFKIIVPPTIEEQSAITSILSDMDAEISALEAKLAKYRHIKQGMMQNLLTGRIRLV